ncbi:MAG: SpoIIE family protein phosphatase [Fluviicola sp.]
MKTRFSSIRAQLLINLLIPVVLVLSAVFYLFYQIDKERLHQKNRENRNNILAETKNLIHYYDHSIREHEKDLIGRMEKLSYELRDRLANQSKLEKVDLYSLSKELGLDTKNEHIYIINKETEILNTTFKKDLGLKFTDFGASMLPHFTNIRLSNKFHEDRFGLETRTGKIKKYSFLPTKDRQYIIELGFYSTQADSYRSLLLKKIRSMGKRYPGVNESYLNLTVKNINSKANSPKHIASAFAKCIKSRKDQTVLIDNPKTKAIEQLEFIFLPVMKSNLYAGYVLELKTDNSEEQKLFQDLLFDFLIIGFIASILLLTLIIWRTKKIADPIQHLSYQTQMIDANHLNENIQIKGSKEIQELGENFNSMIHKLKESYDSLEEKVEIRTEELRIQQHILKEKNQEITESIHYAKFIQDALLPSESLIKAIIPQSFIYFQPKDIIAGDFYWFAERDENYYIAVADCTGHGVPGAMVSVLCINSLNEAFNKLPKGKTGEILDVTRDLVVERLTKESSSLKDGMDISLIKIDFKSKQIEWSGANNPLWIFNENGCSILSPDKQPIGHSDNKIPFTTHTYSYSPTDLFILFSDGFADQFGGPKDKKFKYSTLKELIQNKMHLSEEELKQNLQVSFEEWKGDAEQTDDVCIIGFRI